MSEPIWSRHFAQQIAGILGFPRPEETPDGWDEALRREGERLVAEITEDFRHLHDSKVIGWAIDLARFLAAREDGAKDGCRPHDWIIARLREIREYALFLRGRHGSALPADEKDYWTEEDLHDLQVATWRRLEEDDPWPEDDYPLEERGDAAAG